MAKNKLGKGFWKSYNEFNDFYSKEQQRLSKYEAKLAFAKTQEEAEKAYNGIRGCESVLQILRERLKIMAIAAENTLAQDFAEIENNK